jgi:hypothetical protein
MRKSKLLFGILALIFIIILVLVAIDISSRTTFPGQHKQEIEKVETDSARVD